MSDWFHWEISIILPGNDYYSNEISNDPVGLYGGDRLSVSFSRVKYLALYAKISIVMQIIEMVIVFDHKLFCRR